MDRLRSRLHLKRRLLRHHGLLELLHGLVRLSLLEELALGAKVIRCLHRALRHGGGVLLGHLEGFGDRIGSARLMNRSRLRCGLVGLRLLGLMAVPPRGRDPAPAFARLSAEQHRVLATHPEADRLSAGMSGDRP